MNSIINQHHTTVELDAMLARQNVVEEGDDEDKSEGGNSREENANEGEEGGIFAQETLAAAAICESMVFLPQNEASKLLILIDHARNCTVNHFPNSFAEQACTSAKFAMLHCRDCTGFTSDGRECQHNWCKEVKSVLAHLLNCTSR